MKRKILGLALAALTIATASAVPARRIVKTVTQPDGSTITVTLTGDEWFHSYVTADDLTVALTPEGHAVYTNADGLTAVYAHEANQRDSFETGFIAAQGASLNYQARRSASPKVIAREQQQRQAAAAAANPIMKSPQVEQGESQVPHKGTAHIPIILVEYTDVKFKNSSTANATFQDFFMGEEDSAKKYFTDASLGQYDPEFHVYGPYTLSKSRVYYGGTDYWGNDEKPGHMVKEAIQLANPDVDFSIFDNDGDGICDVVIVLYAGVGQASSGVAQAVWPCQWDLASSGAGSITVDGIKMTKFAVFNELNGSNSSKIDGIGTFCHEFSHCLGLPDFYETTYGNGYFGMDAWSLMDYGCYNDNGYTPIGYSAYEKAFMGWLNLIDGEKNTFYQLPVLNNPDDPQTTAVVLTNKANAKEYFIFENRAKQGWDTYISDQGMLITHVTYDASAWNNNTVNNYALQRMTIVPADNKLTSATINQDLWPKANAFEFTNTSTPAAKTNSGSYLSQPVTEITRDPSTGVVSFWVDRIPVSEIETPELKEPVVEETGSFTASWSPVTIDGTDVSYTLQVWPAADGLPMPAVFTNFKAIESNWSFGGVYKLYSTYLTFGSASSDGYMTSRTAVYPDNGAISVVVNAKRYGTDANPVVVMSLLDSNGNVAAVDEFEVTKDAAYYSCCFNGLDDSEPYTVKIANRGTSKRISVYSVMAFEGDYAGATDEEYKAAFDSALDDSAAAPARAQETTSGDRLTVTGITDTSYKVTGLQNIRYRYRVKAVPEDTTLGKESFWSPVKEIDLSTSGVTDIDVDAPQSTYIISGNELVATPGARLYSVSGVEIKAIAPGRFAPAPGAYILITPGLAPAKIVF